jgi:hypothetical protein
VTAARTSPTSGSAVLKRLAGDSGRCPGRKIIITTSATPYQNTRRSRARGSVRQVGDECCAEDDAGMLPAPPSTTALQVNRMESVQVKVSA